MAETDLIPQLAYAILALPLLSAAVVTIATRRFMFKAAGWLTTAVMAGAFVCSLVILQTWLGMPADSTSTIVDMIPWIPVPGVEGGYLHLGVMIDSLTVGMLVMVTGISTLVHLYSIGYMEGDKRYNRFFSYMSLFTFSMLGIVLANSIIMLFVFWELVGLTSYLLIGFWFEKRGPQLACKKAFVMNRIGDMGFLVGFGILFWQIGGNLLLPAATEQGSLNMFNSVTAALGDGQSVLNPPVWLTIAGIGLFFGAMGKSAQFPLHTWLPDAMEGPTPVSSIVHSATMVAAGVYLTARIYPILTPGAHLFIATIGLITLVMAACMALVMTDIKRVLAYSTLSQLGYMILGLGVGAWGFALFHLITHAFFKCCLFQCSGSVIHAAHHQQDMRYYGGLAKKMPITCACYLICTLTIAGASIPYTSFALSGFFSKDGIIAGAVNYGQVMEAAGWFGNLFWLGPVVIAYVTPFYMARSFALTFLGKPRDQHLYDHAHEVNWTMWLPQAALATMAVISGYIGWQMLIGGAQPDVPYMQTMHAVEAAAHGHGPATAMDLTHGYLLHGLSWIIMVGLGIFIYTPGFTIAEKIVRIPPLGLLHRWAYNKFGFDGLYDGFVVGVGKAVAVVLGHKRFGFDAVVVDGIVNGVGRIGKSLAVFTRCVDEKVVDGSVGGAAAMAQHSGNVLRSTQPGRLRAYVLNLFAMGTIVTVLVIILALVVGAA